MANDCRLSDTCTLQSWPGSVIRTSYVVARSAAKRASVTGLVFDVGEDGTFGGGTEREDVADGESSVLAGVDELGRVSLNVLLPIHRPNEPGQCTCPRWQ